MPRYVMGADGYWYDPHAVENGEAVILRGRHHASRTSCGPITMAMYMLHPQFKYVRNIFRGRIWPWAIWRPLCRSHPPMPTGSTGWRAAATTAMPRPAYLDAIPLCRF